MKPIFCDAVIGLLRQAVRDYGNASALARATGISNANLSRWLSGKQSPRLSEIAPFFDRLGVSLHMPDAEQTRDVHFVSAKIVPAGEQAALPEAEDHIAAPLVEEAGAGHGYIPQDKIKSWVLVYKHQPAVRLRRDLLAVEIGQGSTSMGPVLHPGDIVLVDRGDRNVGIPGRIMLVMDPDGAGLIKRVSIAANGRDHTITLYSDNAAHAPRVYSLRADYSGDWDKVIVGRCVWAWTDLTHK